MTDLANSLLSLDDHDEEQFAHQAPRLVISDAQLEAVARVAYRISQVEAERTRKVLPPGTILKPWGGVFGRERIGAW